MDRNHLEVAEVGLWVTDSPKYVTIYSKVVLMVNGEMSQHKPFWGLQMTEWAKFLHETGSLE